MSPDKDVQLIQKYPILYRGHKEPITQNLMSFGFECGNGWYQLIDELSSKLEKINEGIQDPDVNGIKAVQVKSKFGELRFYYNGPLGQENLEDLEAFIQEAEDKSAETCEECGKPGKIRNQGWVYCCCDECWNEEKRMPKR